jgi:hypothetical protein
MTKYFKPLVLLSIISIFNLAHAQILETIEDFNNIDNLSLSGWVFSNQSSPLGETSWFQGNNLLLIAQEGESDSFIAANYRNTADSAEDEGESTLCNYLIMPNLGDLASVSFYTRSRIASNNFTIFPDRLYMVYSPTGEINTGNCTDDFGDFTETLLVINPDLTQETTSPEGYPLIAWEQFSSEINGNGRVAFVYYVEDAGFFGANSNYIGIDSVEWTLAALPQTIFNVFN